MNISNLSVSKATLFTIPLTLLFFAVMVYVGIVCRRRAVDVHGFVLGGRAVGPWLTAFAFGTSYFSAVIFVGYAGQFGWTFGLASTWIGLGNAFLGSLLAWIVLGRRTRLMTQALGSCTMPDFFLKRYHSKKLMIAASFIVFVFLIPYTASLYNGLSSLFNQVFSIPYWVVVVVMAALTGLYVIFGGYLATAINDFIQGIIMLVGIVTVVIAVLSQNGGLSAAVSKLGEIPTGGSASFASAFGPNPVYLVFVVLLTSLGTWGLPQMVGKFYSIKDEDAIKKGAIISTFFAVVVAGGCYFLGGFGRLYNNPVLYSETGKLFTDRIVPLMLSSLPAIVIAIVIVLVLSASMSTLSSLALTSSSTLALDVILPIARRRSGKEEDKSRDERQTVIVIRLLILFFVALSAIIAILKDSVFADSVFIAQMMGVSWGALAGAFLAPFLYGLYWKRTSRAGVAAGFLFGTGLEIVQLIKSMGLISFANVKVLDFIFQNSLYSGVIAMVGGLVIVPIVSLLTPRTVPEDADGMFACFKKGVENEKTEENV